VIATVTPQPLTGPLHVQNRIELQRRATDGINCGFFAALNATLAVFRGRGHLQCRGSQWLHHWKIFVKKILIGLSLEPPQFGQFLPTDLPLERTGMATPSFFKSNLSL
jgi:hypothetical protein